MVKFVPKKSENIYTPELNKYMFHNITNFKAYLIMN